MADAEYDLKLSRREANALLGVIAAVQQRHTPEQRDLEEAGLVADRIVGLMTNRRGDT